MLSVIFGIINILFALAVFYLTLAFVAGAPFVPSTVKTAEVMIRFAHIKPGMKIYDLGSGDGRLLFAAAERGAEATGFEINPFLVILTAIRCLFSRRRSAVSVRWQNFWSADFRDADVIFVYLLPWRMEALKNKIAACVKPGTLVVSNSFIFPGWKIVEEDRRHHVYAFKIQSNVKSQMSK